MLLKCCSDIANKYGIKVGRVNKLVPNLIDEVRYIVHYKNLQLYLQLVMKLIKIHRILKFKPSNLLKEYIEFNTEKRTEAKDKFSQNFFKLLVNSIYGKTCDNIRKKNNVQLIDSSKDYLICVSKPNFVSQKIFSKNFIAAHQIKSALTLNKPVYVGFRILELSKLLMYQFHYKYAKNKFNDKLLFADRDSLLHEIKSEDVYENFLILVNIQ